MQALDEAVDLLGDRVEVEACAVCGGDAEPSHQRLTAVVSGADRDVTRIFARGGRVDEGPHLLARALEALGCPLGENAVLPPR